MNILKAQLKQAEAKLELIQKQMTRSRIYSPFEGIIVSGDLSQSLGAPVERGEVLYELAPLDEYRVVLEVDEKDIAEVQTKMRGELVLTGAVEENLPFLVKKITPVSENREGSNFLFRKTGRGATSLELKPSYWSIGITCGQEWKA
jgi:multidrug resistance efflux pump